MIPSRIIGKTSGENWIGLIDATYAIILTLLVIELPKVILESIHEHGHRVHSPFSLAVTIGVLIVGYFAIFTVIYDIWSYHKVLLSNAIKLRVFAITTGWLLFTSSLIPPFYYLVNHYTAELLLNPGGSRHYLIYARTCVFALILIIYLILAFLAKMEKRQRGQNLERKQELEIIFATALSKAVISTVLMLTVAGRFRLPPPIGVLILALTTYLPINLFSPLNKTSQRPPLR
jgi:uncharacterized membrane protein